MKNKLILFTLLATNSLCSAPQKRADVYKDIPKIANEAGLQAVLICASWSAKYTVYNFEQFELTLYSFRDFDYHDVVVYTAFNSECTFWLRLNRTTSTIDIEFQAENDSYDYDRFKTGIDSYFLYD
jgi:hypothetical protein